MPEYSSMAKQGDWIRISKYLRANAKKTNLCRGIPDSTYSMPFKVHYKGDNRVITMYDKKIKKFIKSSRWKSRLFLVGFPGS